MGHYASEMDPSTSEPTLGEQKLREIEEAEVRELARCLFKGFDSSPHLDLQNTDHGIRVANAIDALVSKRISVALGSQVDSTVKDQINS